VEWPGKAVKDCCHSIPLEEVHLHRHGQSNERTLRTIRRCQYQHVCHHGYLKYANRTVRFVDFLDPVCFLCLDV
jgi:MoaA/NifB/PqqE/SkfB family radical SAM enzyme